MLVIRILRWAARITGTVILLMIAAIALGEGFPDPRTLTLVDRLTFLAMAGICIGCLLGWRWEAAAGFTILGSVLAFFLLQQVLLLNLVFIPLIVIGSIYLILWRYDASRKER